MSQPHTATNAAASASDAAKMPLRPGFNDNLPATLPDPAAVPLADINPIWPRLFQENAHWGFFSDTSPLA